MRKRIVFLALAFIALPLFAQRREPEHRAEGYGLRNLVPPPRVASLAGGAEITLPRPAALPSHRSNPRTVGIVRNLVTLADATARPASVRSEGAKSIRLKLDDVFLPPGSVAWVYGDRDAQPFGAELLYEGTIWTPSVQGESATLVLPDGGRAFVVAVAHIAGGPAVTDTACYIDASCASGYATRDPHSLSIAAFLYVDDETGPSFCTGGLINGPSGDRLFLTANHCVSSSSEAASVETYWDYKTPSCGAQAMTPKGPFAGATLLTTAEATDMTLLRLATLPTGRSLMGWDVDPVPAGTTLYRISHPQVPEQFNQFAQVYSTARVIATPAETCGRVGSNFVYSTRLDGGMWHGSSGSPVLKAGGYIVGQLYGICPGEPDDGCSNIPRVVDGSLRASYPLLQPFLNPATTGCTASGTVACLLNNRFRVAVNYKNPFSNPPGQPGDFKAARLNQSATNPDLGMFGFDAAQNVEVLVRIQDTRPFAPRFDVYYGGMTDVEYWVNVTDTQTGTTRQYHNAGGKIGGGVDRASFPAN